MSHRILIVLTNLAKMHRNGKPFAFDPGSGNTVKPLA